MRAVPTLALFALLAVSLAPAAAAAAAADPVDEVIVAEMHKRKIPGLSLAIIDGGKLVRVKGYGVIDAGGTTPVTPSTLFQAGSISKPVSAFGALCLVGAGMLGLDEDVNGKLTSWKVPPSEFTRTHPVTLRALLSHTAGFTVHGFPGYAIGAPLPSLADIFAGRKPANTPPIVVDFVPGSRWRYSGGGYTVMQQLVIDVAKKPWAQLLAERVLGPAHMADSSFVQPPTAERARLNAHGHVEDRTPVPGGWHVYPEMAAAGLWTTASDLGRFVMEVQRALAGKSTVVPAALARQMVTEVKDHYGLGVGLDGSGRTLRFMHGGRDEGFDAMMVGWAETGQGAVLMINTNDNSRMTRRILNAIARQYHWPQTLPPAPPASVAVDAKTLAGIAGRYEMHENDTTTFDVRNGRLGSVSQGLPDEELTALGGDRFVTADGEMELAFGRDAAGAVTGLVWSLRRADGKPAADDPEGHGKAARIGPLGAMLTPHADPDAAKTAQVTHLLQSLGKGPPSPADSALVTDVARRDLAGFGGLPPLQSLTFLEQQRVEARGLKRHGGAVASIAYYRWNGDKKPHTLLVYLTADGHITDFDLADD